MNFAYSETDVTKDKFIFASYQHNDMEIVRDAVSWLIGRGVRVWFDADLDVGDDWKKRVEKIVCHKNCCGVLFFCSETAFRSDPIFYERNLVKEKKKQDENFFYMPINIGRPSTLQILRDVFLHAPEEAAELEKYFNCAKMSQILEMFHSEILSCYANPENREGYLTQIYDGIEKNHPEAISSKELKTKYLKNIQSKRCFIKQGETVSVTLGKWLGEKVTLPGVVAAAEDRRFQYKDKEYFQYRGNTYAAIPLQWLVLSVEKDEVLLLSDALVDVRKADVGLPLWLEKSFSALAFSEKEQQLLFGPVRLLRDGDVNYASCAQVMALPSSFPCEESLYWWIDSKAFGNNQKVVKVKDGTVYTGGLTRNKSVGIRPVIEITYEKLITYLEDTSHGNI